ncbi:Mini-ribonuclease 3 [Acholeplasma oculi]|uniref:Mini-ribonuclease 3 n=1 Tax=Acholeplasma oculi TaxID=35623 RepID=A0A061ABY7_9MOLU|nr:ribonuclease III domain-containing protein [Acholeplasma oculi]CDR31385.1 Mini-ribonuclease 3 [Acholeplasma oculi]SKC39580.1 ribonuclease-3 family protein [Acholeplasma oculi]SUT91851.1 Mini-ribonuclease 3 [Acholeplasma oculi]
MNGLSLAYLGDAYYELEIRRYLIQFGYTKVDLLHKMKVKYASNQAQASIMNHLLEQNLLNEEEISYYKKGRNGAHFTRKNINMVDYQQATGFESLIGYLSLHDETRCKEVIQLGIEFIRSGEKDGERLAK